METNKKRSPEFERALKLFGEHVIKVKWSEEPAYIRLSMCPVCNNLLKSSGERKWHCHRRCLNKLLREADD